MAKGILPAGRLAGKTVMINGKFGYGEKEAVEALSKAQGAAVVEDLSDKVDFLVLPDLTANQTLQKKVLSLNGKGASIQVMDAAGFEAMAKATEAELLALVRLGGREAAERYAMLTPDAFNRRFHLRAPVPEITVSGENFDGMELSNFDFGHMGFEGCSFKGAVLEKAKLILGKGCNFERCRGREANLQQVEKARFAGADLTEAEFDEAFGGADFGGARMEKAKFGGMRFSYASRRARGGPAPAVAPVFAKANLKGAQFDSVAMSAPIFAGADLTGAEFVECELSQADFSGAVLRDVSMANCKLMKSDFSGADLRGANLLDADLTDAVVAGADLAGCNLRGAKISGVDFSKARNHNPNASPVGSVGPALTELDTVVSAARRIDVSFRIEMPGNPEGEIVSLQSNYLKYGGGVHLPVAAARRSAWSGTALSFSGALLHAAHLLGNRKIRFETVDVSSTKSPKRGKELRELVIKGLEEAFAQSAPAAEELEKLSKAYREKDKEKDAAAKAEREKARAAAEKVREKEKKQAEKKIEKAVGGKVKDIGTFLTALELRIEEAKIKKATSMLKKSGFQLYNDVTETFMSGVVKSQTDAELVYACRINADGTYACCTQNLNVCGGLRGSICKHLLVLIIGLVKAEKLDPTVIDGWVAKSMHEKAALDKEVMGEIFIKYKGAEAGEVDWRPTETLPEDYYAV